MAQVGWQTAAPSGLMQHSAISPQFKAGSLQLQKLLTVPFGHWQTPLLQICDWLQAVAQTPQLLGSVCRSRQTPWHSVCPGGHAHTPS